MNKYLEMIRANEVVPLVDEPSQTMTFVFSRLKDRVPITVVTTVPLKTWNEWDLETQERYIKSIG